MVGLSPVCFLEEARPYAITFVPCWRECYKGKILPILCKGKCNFDLIPLHFYRLLSSMFLCLLVFTPPSNWIQKYLGCFLHFCCISATVQKNSPSVACFKYTDKRMEGWLILFFAFFPVGWPVALRDILLHFSLFFASSTSVHILLHHCTPTLAYLWLLHLPPQIGNSFHPFTIVLS